MHNLSHAKIEISKTRGGIKIVTKNVSSCRGCDQFARDLMVKLGVKTFELDSGAGYTAVIVYGAWINGEYVERGFFDVFYDFEDKCYYALQDLG